jgi:hypothetical protein
MTTLGLEAAAEAGSEFGKLLKFNKGEWLIGEDTVAEQRRLDLETNR